MRLVNDYFALFFFIGFLCQSPYKYPPIRVEELYGVSFYHIAGKSLIEKKQRSYIYRMGRYRADGNTMVLLRLFDKLDTIGYIELYHHSTIDFYKLKTPTKILELEEGTFWIKTLNPKKAKEKQGNPIGWKIKTPYYQIEVQGENTFYFYNKKSNVFCHCRGKGIRIKLYDGTSVQTKEGWVYVFKKQKLISVPPEKLIGISWSHHHGLFKDTVIGKKGFANKKDLLNFIQRWEKFYSRL